MLYRLPSINDHAAIARLRAQLKKKKFKVTVCSFEGERGFGSSPHFSGKILISKNLFTLVPLDVGDSFHARIGVNIAPGRKTLRFHTIFSDEMLGTVRRVSAKKTDRDKAAANSPQKKTTVKQPAKHKVETDQPEVSVDTVQLESFPSSLESLRQAASDARSSKHTVPSNALYRIYIDESWKSSTTGIIAGVAIISRGSAIPHLPAMKTHLLQGGSRSQCTLNQARQALTALFQTPGVFPFILPIQLSDEQGTASSHYDLLRETSIKLLLGWLLPRSNRGKHSVEIYLERIGTYVEGSDITDQIKGYFSAFKNYDRDRFEAWEISRVEHTVKDFGYVPYGDLLAYIALEKNPDTHELMKVTRLKEFPGYLHLTTRLSRQLNELTLSESNTGISILEFLYDQWGTHFSKIVTDNLKQNISKYPEWREKFLTILQEEFQKKERNLARLRLLTDITFELIGAASAEISPRTALMHTLIKFQQANHHGASERIQPLINSYLRFRKQLKEEEFTLTTYTDLNLAVSFADAFNYRQSLLLIREILENPGFAALSSQEKGRAYSAQGQYLSMSGEQEKAEYSFETALKYFARMHHSNDLRKKEMEQTRIYRAINAVNGKFQNARSLVEQTISLTENSVGTMSVDGTYQKQYLHHLLVRSLWLLDNPSITSLQQCYIKQRNQWRYYKQHPWELICMYRALFLRHTSRDEAKRWFDHALDICCFDEHGNTLKLIGAMIAVVAYCALSDKKYKTQAETMLTQVSPFMPHAASAISSLHQILAAPTESSIAQALATCPFNYH